MKPAVKYRQDLVKTLVSNGAVRSPWLRRAFEETPRETFVPRFYQRGDSGQKVLVDGTVEAGYFSWRRLGVPDVAQFGVTALDDVGLQHVWYEHPDSRHRWPLPL